MQREFWVRLKKGGMRMARAWWPAADAPPCAMMAIVPGLGDHSGRYQPLAQELNKSRIAVVSMDLHGHGLSPGWRGCIESYDSLLEEVNQLVSLAGGHEELQQYVSDENWTMDRAIELKQLPQQGSLPVCLYGHSMGGNLVLNAVMRGFTQPDRVIASAPMLRAVHPPAPLIIKLARILKIIAPHYRLKAPVRKELLSHVELEKEAYKNDSLMHRQVSLRLGAALIDSGVWVMEHPEQLSLPTLILHGAEDRITDPLASEAFAKQAIAAGKPCEFRLYARMLHDLHRDIGRERVIADIRSWCETGQSHNLSA